MRNDTHSTIFDFRPHIQSRLPPEVNRIVYVRNLPFSITADELYAIFGKYGAIFQIRLGDKDKDTRGTAFVVYEVGFSTILSQQKRLLLPPIHLEDLNDLNDTSISFHRTYTMQKLRWIIFLDSMWEADI